MSVSFLSFFVMSNDHETTINKVSISIPYNYTSKEINITEIDKNHGILRSEHLIQLKDDYKTPVYLTLSNHN